MSVIPIELPTDFHHINVEEDGNFLFKFCLGRYSLRFFSVTDLTNCSLSAPFPQHQTQRLYELPTLFYSLYYYLYYRMLCGPGSSVGIATDYGLDSPGIESRCGEIFRNCPDRPWGPTSLLYNGYRVFPGGKVRPGRAADHSPPSSAVVMEE